MQLLRFVRDVLAIAVGLVVFLALWKAVVFVGSYPAFILPTPETVALRFVDAWRDGTIPRHASWTLLEIFLGFLVGTLVAIPVGDLVARSPLAERLLSPYIVAAQATPVLALAPLIALWFGTGLLSKVVICALIVFFPVAVSTSAGLRSVDAGLLEIAHSYRATSRQLFTQVEIPAALPQVLSGMRIGVTLAVIGAIVGEWAGGDRGLGVLINLARGSLFDTPLLFATLLTIALIGIALYLVVRVVEWRLVGWQQ